MISFTNECLQGTGSFAPPLNTDEALGAVLTREAMEELHRLAGRLSGDDFEALMPLAICLFANCVGVTSVEWISPATVRCLLLGPRQVMFDWLDDVFNEACEDCEVPGDLEPCEGRPA
jgi:hypothetical protein